jgi:hypothetical protein
MSRRTPADNSAAVSLFPFLAVLLCTMGALLVVLVAVSRAAREAALRDNAAERQIATAEPDPNLQRELERISQFQAGIQQVRSQAEQQIRQDQLRLAQLEDHMRRLHDQLSVLEYAAAELDALEEEHYDDREQAQREIERLERLIAEARQAIDVQKERLQSSRRSYALIPYEGPNGTFRRPLYIECRNNELILQPEGVRVRRDDLYPPFGAGNPLASALRAARDYHMQLHREESQGRDTEPYPLLVVRPDGLLMYDLARRAIESSDFDFGFELVEEHWELKYPVADPKLALVEQQAIDQARLRQRALAAAAPRAYRHPALAAAGTFDSGGEGELGFGGEGLDDDSGELFSAGSDGTGEVGNGPAGAGGDELAEAADKRSGASGSNTSLHSDQQGETPDRAAPGQADVAAASEHGADALDAAGGPGGDMATDPNSGNVVVTRGAPPQQRAKSQPTRYQAKRGQDWALDRKKPSAVPIRRTIQAVIRGDQLTILCDDARVEQAAPAGKRVAIQGDTVESLDPIVVAVRQHIDGWGFAGDGMYWRPVLILTVGPDGEQRARDLNRLLKNSGIELRVAEFVTNNPNGPSRATPAR